MVSILIYFLFSRLNPLFSSFTVDVRNVMASINSMDDVERTTESSTLTPTRTNSHSSIGSSSGSASDANLDNTMNPANGNQHSNDSENNNIDPRHSEIKEILLTLNSLREMIKKKQCIFKKNTADNLSSDIWDTFSQIYTSENELVMNFLWCPQCNNALAYNKMQGTRNHSRHLEKCKPEKQNKIKEFFHKENEVSSQDKKRITEACAKFCYLDCRPYYVVKGEGFLELCFEVNRVLNKYGPLSKAAIEEAFPAANTVNKIIFIYSAFCFLQKSILPTGSITVQIDLRTIVPERETRTTCERQSIMFSGRCLARQTEEM